MQCNNQKKSNLIYAQYNNRTITIVWNTITSSGNVKHKIELKDQPEDPKAKQSHQKLNIK